ncbi:hypothetical protein [Natronorubrum sp. FCH18a]|uniref:hypothetical protein n=1 Tax=Natronorubrum sp. FCH18a TaxID=3447018 RepID=UPI003F510BE5
MKLRDVSQLSDRSAQLVVPAAVLGYIVLAIGFIALLDPSAVETLLLCLLIWYTVALVKLADVVE